MLKVLEAYKRGCDYYNSYGLDRKIPKRRHPENKSSFFPKLNQVLHLKICDFDHHLILLFLFRFNPIYININI